MTEQDKKAVVVVDDSPSLITLFQRATEKMDNIDLFVYNSTNEAWTYLEHNQPDLLFLNIKMPGKDGLTILRELRRLPRHKDTPVVMISSKDYAQDRGIASELGAIDYITKPMPIQVIKDAIARHLNL